MDGISPRIFTEFKENIFKKQSSPFINDLLQYFPSSAMPILNQGRHLYRNFAETNLVNMKVKHNILQTAVFLFNENATL